MRIKLTILASLLLAPTLGCRAIVNRMAFEPDTVSTIPRHELPPEVKEVFITTKDDVRIQGYFMANHSAKKIVIFFHGNGGNVSHRLADLLRIKQSGVNVLGVDYRGYGKSEGKPSEKGIYRDGEASLAYAIQELRFSEKNIYLFGRSIGTTVAINTAQKKNLAGLILVSPLTSGKAQAKATGKGVLSFLAGASFRNIDKIQNIACPVLVVHGTNDKIIPYAMGVSVYSAIQTKKKFVTITGAGHNNMRSDFTLEYWHPILDFIKNGI